MDLETGGRVPKMGTLEFKDDNATVKQCCKSLLPNLPLILAYFSVAFSVSYFVIRKDRISSCTSMSSPGTRQPATADAPCSPL